MKLYPLLFIDEAAKTAEDAFKAQLIAIDASGNDNTYRKIVLINPSRFLEAFTSVTAEHGKYNPRNYESSYDIIDSLKAKTILDATNRAIIGSIGYSKEADGLYKIDTSAAVDKFGPLAYQMVMYLIKPAWLISDTSLKPASKAVWQKMYELSQEGVYTRKFLGEFANKEYLESRLGIDYDFLRSYDDKVSTNQIPPTEAGFISWLEQKNKITGGKLKPSHFGFLWAYQKVSHDPQIGKLFRDGKQFLSLTRVNEKITIKNLKSVLRDLGSRFFAELYGSEESYTE